MCVAQVRLDGLCTCATNTLVRDGNLVASPRDAMNVIIGYAASRPEGVCSALTASYASVQHFGTDLDADFTSCGKDQQACRAAVMQVPLSRSWGCEVVLT